MRNARKLLTMALTTMALTAVMVMAVGAEALTVGDAESGATYTSLQTALENANSNDTVKLISDITIESGEIGNNQGIIEITQSITLDGQGNTITFQDTATSNQFSAINVNGNVTGVVIQNVTLTVEGENTSIKHGINVYEGASATLNQVTSQNFLGCGLVVNGATVEAYGLTTSGNGWYAGVNVSKGGGVTTPPSFTFDENCSFDEPGKVYADHADAQASWVTAPADWYMIEKNSDNKIYWIDTVPPVQNDTKYYATLQEAIDGASAEDVITLLDDITLTEDLYINKSLTIQGNDNTLDINYGNKYIYTQGADSDIVLQNLTIQHGSQMGAIRVHSSDETKSITLENVIVYYGTQTSDNVGYGIHVQNSSADTDIIATNCQFLLNDLAASNWGIYNLGTGDITLVDCVFQLSGHPNDMEILENNGGYRAYPQSVATLTNWATTDTWRTGTTAYLTTALTLTEDMTVGTGKTLVIATGGVLTVPTGIAFDSENANLTGDVISFSAGAGSCGTAAVVIEEGGTLSSIPSASRSGYSFNGWYYEGSKVTVDTVFGADATVTASYSKRVTTTPTVTPEEETIPEEEAAPEEETIPEEEVIPEEETIPEEEAAPEEETTTTVAGMTDVSEDDWYYEAVSFAVQMGITNGTDESGTQFSPDDACTRGQIVAMLFRAVSEPEAEGDFEAMDDVDSEAYYADAVTWAVQNGITDGMGDGLFGTDETCTRGQIVTFLYRLAGEPAVEGTSAFEDVADGEYYTDAVIWAVENGITDGMGDGTFAPDEDCTRAQIVTFIYRYLAE